MRFLPLLGVAVVLVAGTPASSAVARRSSPTAIAFWDARHGLVALTSFTPCRDLPPAEQIAVDRTSDGGRTWRRVREMCASETAFGGSVTLATAGPQSAMLATPGGLLRTDDRGTSWSPVRAPHIVALSFTSRSHGWAVVGGSYRLSLRETRDSGRTWRQLPIPCDGEFAKLSLVTSGHAWLLCLGAAGAGNQGKAVYETRDGATRWRLRARTHFITRGAGRLDSYGYPTDVAFRADGRGWMPQLRGATLTTHDGGRTWLPLAVTAPEARLGVSVSFVSNSAGFILVQDEVRRRWQLERTHDGGRTWRAVHAWPM